jgi:hypothetical protein
MNLSVLKEECGCINAWGTEKRKERFGPYSRSWQTNWNFISISEYLGTSSIICSRSFKWIYWKRILHLGNQLSLFFICNMSYNSSCCLTDSISFSSIALKQHWTSTFFITAPDGELTVCSGHTTETDRIQHVSKCTVSVKYSPGETVTNRSDDVALTGRVV